MHLVGLAAHGSSTVHFVPDPCERVPCVQRAPFPNPIMMSQRRSGDTAAHTSAQ